MPGLEIERVLTAAVRAGLLADDVPVAGFLHSDGIRRTVADLQTAFAEAPGVTHTFAVKANPLIPVLRLLRESGMGCEVASPGELAVALAAGFAPDRIVLDSPAKTTNEVRHGLDLGVAVNLDNFQELDRVDTMMRERPSSSVIGLRINPQVGSGSIDYMSTATATSKFGIALQDQGARSAVIAAFADRPWLTRIHAHVGSQGCPLELIAGGIAAVYDLAEEINSVIGTQQVTSLDIGGGLPVNFDDDEIRPTFADYAKELRRAIPAIFDGRYHLITEFGRSVLAKNGMTIARVEYTKDAGGTRVVLTHAGAQVATRTVFMPAAWPIRVIACDRTGALKTTPLKSQDIGGPLCFAGDMIARARELPELEPGDLIVLPDTGAYYFSSPWTYNSLPSPAVYGYTIGEPGDDTIVPGAEVRFALVRSAQTLAEVVAANGAAQVDALL